MGMFSSVEARRHPDGRRSLHVVFFPPISHQRRTIFVTSDALALCLRLVLSRARDSACTDRVPYTGPDKLRVTLPSSFRCRVGTISTVDLPEQARVAASASAALPVGGIGCQCAHWH